jgi:hypothetical protein
MDVTQDLRRRLKDLGECFLQEFLEVEISRHPSNVEALAELGHVYTNRGLWALGMGVDQRLIQLMPENPTAHYNLACSHALLGDARSAFESLETAAFLGYDEADYMEQDDDLASLRQDPRFRSLIERIRAGEI